MKKLLTVLSLLSVFVAASAFADSSGNFTATGTSWTCTATPATFNPATGNFEGDTLGASTKHVSFTTSIRTPSGKGTALLIRPSLDTGLFTATKLSTTINNATADVGIRVCVNVDPTDEAEDSGLPVSPTNCVVYDQRIQQVSNTLFGNLATCVNTFTTTACASAADCPAGDICANNPCTAANVATACPSGNTCVNIDPVTGIGSCSGTACQGPAPGCNFEILLTTLAAHSFDFVVKNMKNGDHKVVMKWDLIGTDKNTVGGSTLACVGPVTLTVQQVKNFSNDQVIEFLTD